MSFVVERKGAIKLMGTSMMTENIEGQNNMEIPKFWDALCENGMSEKLSKLSKPNNPHHVMYGVCIPEGQAMNEFRYLIGVPYCNNDESFEIYDIPEADWAIFKCLGPMPDAMQSMWVEIFTAWLPNETYDIDLDLPQIEFYTSGDPNSSDYYTEIWIPVVKK